MERIILIEKHNEEFKVDVNLSYKVVGDKLIVTLLFDGQSKELDFQKSDFDEIMTDCFDVDFIEECIFDEKFNVIKTEVSDWCEPTPQIDEMSDFDFYRSKI
jgi:hypothetical protein